MKISILISTYNGEKDIRPLLDSINVIERGSYELEVILRDDDSSDDTVKIVEQEYGWVKLISGKGRNLGFVKSNNIAFRQSTGAVICCVNQDTILHPLFIMEGMNILQQDPQVVGVNTNMIMPWVMSIEQFREKKQREFSAFEYQLTPYGFVRYVEVEKTAHQTNFMTGGGFFIRKSCIPQGADLFDPAFDMYCEDTELSLRLLRLGGTIMYCPEAIIYHNQASKKATTVRELIKLVQITRNRFALYAKIYSPFVFSLKYPIYLIGIVKKMSYLGLARRERNAAYVVGTGLAFLFFCLFPYWLIYSLRRKPSLKAVSNCA